MGQNGERVIVYIADESRLSEGEYPEDEEKGFMSSRYQLLLSTLDMFLIDRIGRSFLTH